MDEDGKTAILKNNQSAAMFTASSEFRKWCSEHLTPRTQIALVHTRAATKGLAYYNENNHPITAGKGVIIHNGMLRNDDALFETNKDRPSFKRSCATDSDVFRALLDNWIGGGHGGIDKGLIKEMSLADGVAAVAAVHPDCPGKLLLLRDSNPLVIGATRDQMIFASDKTAIYKALKPWVKLHNTVMQVHAPDLSFHVMSNETGYIWGPKGFETHEVFKCNGRGFGGYTAYSKKHKSTTYNFKKSHEHAVAQAKPPEKAATALVTVEKPKDSALLPEYVICNNSFCNAHVELTPDDRKLANLAYLACSECKTNLSGAVEGGPPN